MQLAQLHRFANTFMFYSLQKVYGYEYPPEVPLQVRESCTQSNISLLHAEECLFYAYGQQEWIKYIWALGLLAAGQTSTMTVSVSSDKTVTYMYTRGRDGVIN